MHLPFNCSQIINTNLSLIYLIPSFVLPNPANEEPENFE